MKNTSPTLVMTALSTALRNIPVPSTSGCNAGLDKMEKIRVAGALMSRDSATDGWVKCSPVHWQVIRTKRTTAHNVPQFDHWCQWWAISSWRTVRRGPLCCLLYTSDAADDLLCVDLGG